MKKIIEKNSLIFHKNILSHRKFYKIRNVILKHLSMWQIYYCLKLENLRKVN